MSLHPCAPALPGVVSQVSLAWVGHTSHPQWGAPIIDCHDHVYSWKGHHVLLIGDLVDFHSSGEGPRGHEILHHAAVPELVLDGVGVVRADLLEELLEVVCGRSCLTLVAACGSRGVHHAGAAHLLVVAGVVASHGSGLLKMLLVPLPTTHGALPGALGSNIG
jgi:hypothetical protein